MRDASSSPGLRTPLRFLTSQHMQLGPASAESKLEPLRKLLDDGQVTPDSLWWMGISQHRRGKVREGAPSTTCGTENLRRPSRAQVPLRYFWTGEVR